jgi:acetyltransferase
MSIRNLDHFFKPHSIALLGASDAPGSVGAALTQNLLNSRFAGPIMLVNPARTAVYGRKVWPGVDSLPEPPGLAVIATPPATVPDLIGKLGQAGTKAAIVITAGFGEGGREQGLKLRQSMLEASRPHLLRIVGPNCFGIVVPALGLNVSFGRVLPKPGRLALVSQSGAINAAISDWASLRGIGFSHVISIGDMADVDFGDLLDYLASDKDAAAILLYIETITHARKFMSAARAAARSKPVIVVKSGRRPEGAKAASSHTGALAGADDVYDAVFRRAGMLRVDRLEHLFEAAETLSLMPRPRGERLAIISNGGGLGVLASDAAGELGIKLASLAPATLTKLNAALPPTWSQANPVDIIGDAGTERYAAALDAVMADPGVDALLVIHCPTAIQSSTSIADTVVQKLGQDRRLPVIACWAGGLSVQEGQAKLTEAGVANFETPETAVRAFAQIVTYWRNQSELMETPPSIPELLKLDTAKARSIISQALQEGRRWLDPAEAMAVLETYEIPVIPTIKVTDPEHAAREAARLGGKLALKIHSPDILHKSDVGGVALGLEGADAVRGAAHTMLAKVRQAKPNAKITGLLLQAMVERPKAHNLLIGSSVDHDFGPVIVFGHGGIAVEVVADRAIALPPLNMKLAQDAMERTRVIKLLRGFRNEPPADLDAIAFTMVKVSQMLIDLEELCELDINPLLADANGVIAVDARIRVSSPGQAGANRLAIRPYPSELEEIIRLSDGTELLLRPIVPEDEPALSAAVKGLDSEEARLRFLMPVRELSRLQAARFTQIDYDREMALIATHPGKPGTQPILAVVRIAADPDNEKAEFAIIVKREITGKGLGTILLDRIISYAKKRGIGVIFGDVLRENSRMLELGKALGFARSNHPGDATLIRLTLDLRQ